MRLVSYELLRRVMRQHAGIMLEPGKDSLVRARLMPIARSRGLRTLDELCDRLVGDGSLRDKIIAAMTTNETQFFRDREPFVALADTVLPDVIRRNAAARRITIWSAACAERAVSAGVTKRDDLPVISRPLATRIGVGIGRGHRRRPGNGGTMRITAMMTVAMLATACEPGSSSYADSRTAVIEGSLRPANPQDPGGLWIGTEVTTLLASGGLESCEALHEIEARPTESACPDCTVSLKIDISALAGADDCVTDTSLPEGGTVSFTPTVGPNGTLYLDTGAGPQEVAVGHLDQALTWRMAVQVRGGQILSDLPFRGSQETEELPL